MRLRPGLKDRLDRLVEVYGPARAVNDPVSLPRRFENSRDREVAGLVAAVLAFGAVRQVLRSGNAVLDALGSHPTEAVRRGTFSGRLSGFRHRWVGEEDVELLLVTLGRVLSRFGSLEAFFLEGFDPVEADLGAAIDSFSRRMKAEAAGLSGCGPGFRFLFPEPGRGGAAKRLCLFLRWMVRPEDGIDMGVWSGIPPSALVVPLDTHVSRISRYLGLTGLKTVTFRTALDVTRNLKRLAPRDPVRYDFAIAQLGISRDCRHRYVSGICESCPLFEVCVLARRR